MIVAFHPHGGYMWQGFTVFGTILLDLLSGKHIPLSHVKFSYSMCAINIFYNNNGNK